MEIVRLKGGAINLNYLILAEEMTSKPGVHVLMEAGVDRDYHGADAEAIRDRLYARGEGKEVQGESGDAAGETVAPGGETQRIDMTRQSLIVDSGTHAGQANAIGDEPGDCPPGDGPAEDPGHSPANAAGCHSGSRPESVPMPTLSERPA